MNEEELMEDQEQPELELEEDSSPSENEQEVQPAEDEAPEQEASEPQVPFHEHPRFQEVIRQKNEANEQLRQLREQNEQMQRQFEQFQKQMAPEPVEAKVLRRLEQVDPEFAQVFRAMKERADATEALKQQIEELAGYRQQSEQQSQAQRIESTLNQLHSEHKVEQGWQPMYRARVEALVRAEEAKGNRLSVSDLPRIYKAAHDEISKLTGNVAAKTRESYVQGKRADSKAPPAKKGKPASNIKGGIEWSKLSEEDAKATAVQEILKQSRAESDV